MVIIFYYGAKFSFYDKSVEKKNSSSDTITYGKVKKMVQNPLIYINKIMFYFN